MQTDNLIPIDIINKDFDHFINIPSNKRIFFSGKFGTGKTHFLNKFFENNKDKYELFHLYPINYQITSNDDVVELLKYDILIETLKKKEDIFNTNTVNGVRESYLLFYSWIKQRATINDVLQGAVSLLGVFEKFEKLGKPLIDLLKLDKEFQDFKKEYLLGEKGIAENYLAEIKSKTVSENDYIGYLIKQKIEQLKNGKKSILILDDMDRIDPDHIFRILNIFSAHYFDDDNKFGFESVIIVGDIENIRSIFHHKYGSETDFEGYFDKFFTVKPYYLDNKNVITKLIPELVKMIKIDETQLQTAFSEGGTIKIFFTDVFSRALDTNFLTLRQIFKPLYYSFPEVKKGSWNKDNYGDQFKQIFDLATRLLISIFGGDKKRFIHILLEIRKNVSDQDDGHGMPYEYYYKNLLTGLNVSLEQKRIERGDYVINQNGPGNFYVEGHPSNKTKLFYDLYIEYIEKNKYAG